MPSFLRTLATVLVPLAIVTGCAGVEGEGDPADEALTSSEVSQVETQRDGTNNPVPRDVCLYNCFTEAGQCIQICSKLFCRSVCNQIELECQQRCPKK